MRSKLMLPGIALASAITLFAAGCGTETSAPTSTRPFVSMMTRGVNVDFDPLATPQDAIEAGDLVIEGTLSGVTDGISLKFADPVYTDRWNDSYVTLVIAVDRVISGNPAQIHNGKVFVEVLKNKAVSAQELSAANVNAQVVAVLDNLADWKPADDVVVARPSTVPTAATLFAGYTDGLWLQGSTDLVMYGIGAEPEQLGPAWGGADTVAEYAARIRQAL